MTIPPPDPALVERFRRDVAALAAGPDEGLGVAVSGGADSLALLLLAHAAFPGNVCAISIDHGLRAEAAGECRFVGDVCAALGVAHDIEQVIVRPAGEGVQAAARHARDMAFGGWCRRRRVAWLMTGHHADDQAETVLMRLARGAGVGGLSGIDVRRDLPAMPLEAPVYAPSRAPALLRPLLGWTRDELAALVGAAGLVPVADPANEDARYDRTSFRALVRDTPLLDVRRLGAVARNCRDAEEAIEWIVAGLDDQHLVADGEDRVLLAMDKWPREILRRLVLNAFATMAAYPDGPATMRLIGLLQAGRTATLAGIKATPGEVWTFTRAPPRRTG